MISTKTELIELNKEKLNRLNLPQQIGRQKIFILDVYTPYDFEMTPIQIVDGNSRRGIHGNSVAQVIEQIYPGAEFYFGSSLVKAIDYCMANDIRIINASISAPYTRSQNEALKKYCDWGGIFVAAAGNEEGNKVSFPGNSPYTICVSATNVPDCDGPEIDITSDSGWWVYNASNGLLYPFTGTSCATPVITACVAYMLDYCPQWRCEDVRQFLKENSVPLTEQYERFFSFPDGFGREVNELTKMNFIKAIIPGAIKSYREQGVLPSLTLAQACLESNFGQSGLAKKSKNLFGIKWSEGCGYGYDEYSTREWNGNEYITVKAKFRKYGSYDESIIDHGKLLLLSRYKPVIYSRDYKEAAKHVQECGYATDPAYAAKLINLIEAYSLNQYDRGGYKMFNDFDKVSDWAKGAVEKVRELGIMNGDANGNFNPKANLTREEAAQMIVNLYNKVKGV